MIPSTQPVYGGIVRIPASQTMVCKSKEVHVCAYHMAELPRAIAEHQVAELTGDRNKDRNKIRCSLTTQEYEKFDLAHRSTYWEH